MVDVCNSCEREMRIQSRGMCTSCYRKQLFRENPAYRETTRAQEREAKRLRRLNDEEWREQQRQRDRDRRPGRMYSGNFSLCDTPGCVAKGLCRRCYNRTRMQEIRAANPQHGRNPEGTRQQIVVNYEAIRTAKSAPCLDCRGIFPLECMDLDHVRGEKLFNLSKAGPRNHQRVLEEIAKCDVVCANCHRTRTKTRANARGRKGMC